MTDTPIEIRYAPARLIGFVALGVMLTALCAMAALKIAPAGSFGQFVCFVGVPFFGLCTLIALGRLINDRHKVVVRITETGFTDIRIAAEEIPWTAIHALATMRIRRQNILVLDVDPAVEARLTLSRIVRWSRSANAALGIQGLATSAQGLSVNYATLLDLCETRLRAASQP